jgi:hypothetical protein
MIRIDDDRLIDDTLISCAEYQLFLDEMRAQRQYYQPDHWPDCEFPTGQAHALLLGIRASDAVAFCRWLSARELGEWQFRLPTPTEAQAHPLPLRIADAAGYWVYGPTDEGRGFVRPRLNRPPTFSGRLELSPDLERDVERARQRNQACDLDLASDLVAILASDATPSDDLTSEFDLTYARVIDRGLDSDRARLRDLARGRIRNRARTRDRLSELDVAYARVIERGLDSDHDRARSIVRERDRARARDIALDIDSALDRTIMMLREHDRLRDIALARERALAIATGRVRDVALDLYLALLILEERIQGHLQPFEGIRLLKERRIS